MLEAKKLTHYTFSILIFLALNFNLGESLLDLLILFINLLKMNLTYPINPSFKYSLDARFCDLLAFKT